MNCYFSGDDISGECPAQYWLVAGCFALHVTSQPLCRYHMSMLARMLDNGGYCAICGNAVEEWLIQEIG